LLVALIPQAQRSGVNDNLSAELNPPPKRIGIDGLIIYNISLHGAKYYLSNMPWLTVLDMETIDV
jgi:hypothetical protein